MNAFGITDKGKVRSINQDTFDLHVDRERERAVLALCDGMGGEKAGEIASNMACSRFMSHVLEAFAADIVPLSVDIARESAAWANLSVYDRAYSDDSLLLTEVQPAGKKRMSAAAFLLGHPIKCDEC